MKKGLRLLLILLLFQFLVVCFYAGSLDNPKYSFIGDEYNFYAYAEDIALGGYSPNPLSLDGVFHEHAVLGSFYQAMFMRVFGIDIYAWKLSSIVIIFPLGLLMFYLVKRIATIPAAIFALLAIDFSFYYYNFFQIGYLNNLSLLCLVGIMHILTFINPKDKSPSYKPFLILGLVTGLSWFFYIGKLFLVVVTLYLLILTKLKRTFFRPLTIYLLATALLISTSFLSTPQNRFGSGLTKTLAHREFSDNTIILKNMFYPFVLHLYTPTQTHYLPKKSYTDAITATLATFGFILMLVSIFVKRYRLYPEFHRFLLLFVIVAFIVGFTSPYPLPPVTRGIHYVPFYILFAAYCLAYVTYVLREKKYVPWAVYAVAIAGMLYLNIAFIRAPVVRTTTDKLFSDLKQEKNKDIYFLKNKHCFNFNLLVIMNYGFNLPNSAQIADKVDKNLCKKGNVIVTCGVNVCGKKPTKVFDKFIYFYKF